MDILGLFYGNEDSSKKKAAADKKNNSANSSPGNSKNKTQVTNRNTNADTITIPARKRSLAERLKNRPQDLLDAIDQE
jgi:hypothetical protein